MTEPTKDYIRSYEKQFKWEKLKTPLNAMPEIQNSCRGQQCFPIIIVATIRFKRTHVSRPSATRARAQSDLTVGRIMTSKVGHT
jgi:hypothetical protein